MFIDIQKKRMHSQSQEDLGDFLSLSQKPDLSYSEKQENLQSNLQKDLLGRPTQCLVFFESLEINKDDAAFKFQVP